ncbi:MAG TPA: UvrD-helicase domain-containing protein, partial [Gammaproteobacteria bacterium]|nr:UvrD-helicase domain-containing protein [Gammaproteobacteria bacterium]
MNNDLLTRDQQQRQQALNPTESFIVQAPAGSGKTALLIQRLLTLLSVVNAPEEILAITFTKKAANEMRVRVIKALKQAQTQPEPESAHAKHTWLLAKKVLARDAQFQWQLINNPNQLRIQTIDSLCTHLTRQLPLLSHFGSQPEITEHPKRLYAEAVKEVLRITMVPEEITNSNLDWSEEMLALLSHLDNDINKVHDLLISMLAKRDQWLPYIQFNLTDEAIKRQLEQQIQQVIDDHLNYLQRLMPSSITEQLLPIARFAADQLIALNINSPIQHCRDLTALPSTPAAWLGVATLLLTKAHTWRKKVSADIGFPALTNLKNPQEKSLHAQYRQQFTELLTQCNEREDLRLALEEVFFLPE